jgi:hypothetical protein
MRSRRHTTTLAHTSNATCAACAGSWDEVSCMRMDRDDKRFTLDAHLKHGHGDRRGGARRAAATRMGGWVGGWVGRGGAKERKSRTSALWAVDLRAAIRCIQWPRAWMSRGMPGPLAALVHRSEASERTSRSACVNWMLPDRARRMACKVPRRGNTPGQCSCPPRRIR